MAAHGQRLSGGAAKQDAASRVQADTDSMFASMAMVKLSAKVASLQAAVEALGREKTEAQQQVEAERQARQTCETETLKLRQQVRQAASQHGDQVAKLQSQLNAAAVAHNETAIQLEARNAELDALTSARDASHTELRNQVTQLQAALTAAQNSLTSKHQVQVQMQSLVDALEGELQSLRKQVNKCQESLSGQQDAFSSHMEWVAIRLGQQEEMCGLLEERQAALEEARRVVQEQTQALALQVAMCEQHQAAAQAAQAATRTAEQRIAAAEAALTVTLQDKQQLVELLSASESALVEVRETMGKQTMVMQQLTQQVAASHALRQDAIQQAGALAEQLRQRAAGGGDASSIGAGQVAAAVQAVGGLGRAMGAAHISMHTPPPAPCPPAAAQRPTPCTSLALSPMTSVGIDSVHTPGPSPVTATKTAAAAAAAASVCAASLDAASAPAQPAPVQPSSVSKVHASVLPDASEQADQAGTGAGAPATSTSLVSDHLAVLPSTDPAPVMSSEPAHHDVPPEMHKSAGTSHAGKPGDGTAIRVGIPGKVSLAGAAGVPAAPAARSSGRAAAGGGSQAAQLEGQQAVSQGMTPCQVVAGEGYGRLDTASSAGRLQAAAPHSHVTPSDSTCALQPQTEPAIDPISPAAPHDVTSVHDVVVCPPSAHLGAGLTAADGCCGGGQTGDVVQLSASALLDAGGSGVETPGSTTIVRVESVAGALQPEGGPMSGRQWPAVTAGAVYVLPHSSPDQQVHASGRQSASAVAPLQGAAPHRKREGGGSEKEPDEEQLLGGKRQRVGSVPVGAAFQQLAVGASGYLPGQSRQAAAGRAEDEAQVQRRHDGNPVGVSIDAAVPAADMIRNVTPPSHALAGLFAALGEDEEDE